MVTGSTGYLGGRLIQYLNNNFGYRLLIAVRDPKKIPSEFSHLDFIVMAESNSMKYREACSGVDCVIHLAGLNASQCVNSSNLVRLNDVETTANLLDAAIKHNVKRFIYLSTAHVYSENLSGTIDEKLKTTNSHPYALQHLEKEKLVAGAIQRGEIEGIVIRLSNAFGAPINKDANCWMLLMNDLCRQAATTGKIVLKSNGKQRRDFIAISDFCPAIQHFMHLSREKLSDGLFNVGGQWVPTVLEVAHCIAKRFLLITGQKIDICVPADSQKTAQPLVFSTQKLLASGYHLTTLNILNHEIDSLILFCLTNFSEASN